MAGNYWGWKVRKRRRPKASTALNRAKLMLLKLPNEVMTERRFRDMWVFGRLVYIRRKAMKYYRPSRSDGRRRRQWDERP